MKTQQAMERPDATTRLLTTVGLVPVSRLNSTAAGREQSNSHHGGTMLRKHIVKVPPSLPVPHPGDIDIVATAIVLVTSEDPAHPIDNVFDDRRGPGGSRWVAAEPGEQTLLLVFDTPQTMCTLHLEVEELDVSRTQELYVAISRDGEHTYQELLRQEYTFSPPGTTFEREEWSITAEGVTHLRLVITPDKGGKPCQAMLTALALW
jgi:hypothetical protein